MKNVLFISLGCDKNLVDSEKMLGLLSESGYTIVEDEAEADAIVINTCCFIHDAKEESIETILEMASWKEKGRLRALVITGCLAQRYKDEIAAELPEVDAVIGTSGYTEIVPVLDKLLKVSGTEEAQTDGECPLVYCPSIDLLPPSLPDKRMVTTGAYTAYLKIAEGCNKRCTYCVIPYIRGRYRSFPVEDLLKEAERLVAGGARELILIAQETTVYGVDLYGRKMLPELLRKLCRLEGLDWIRILYCYPEEITDELIQVMKEEKKVCHYLDIPIQHASDRILKRMGRRTSKQELIDIVGKLRKEIPDIVLRTTLITGFPGETEEDHEELKEFVDEMEFDRLGVFTYSPEENTPAAEMADQVPEEVKEERRDELMELQQEISYDRGQDRIGQELLVMIEGKVADESAYIGRTYGDAPKVDGYIFVQTGELLMTGDFAKVRVTGALEYDLIGVLSDEYTE